MARANQRSTLFQHEFIHVPVLVLGILEVPTCGAVMILNELQVDLIALRARLEELVESTNNQKTETKAVIEKALAMSREAEDGWIGTEHFLLGVLCQTGSPTAVLFSEFGVSEQSFNSVFDRLRPSLRPSEPSYFKRFTFPARRAMANANAETIAAGGDTISTSAILLGLLSEENSRSAITLRRLNLDFSHLRQQARLAIKGVNSIQPNTRLPQTPRSKKVIQAAMDLSDELRHKTVGTEHFLLAMMRQAKCGGARILSDAGVTCDFVLKTICELPRAAE